MPTATYVIVGINLKLVYKQKVSSRPEVESNCTVEKNGRTEGRTHPPRLSMHTAFKSSVYKATKAISE